jgi:hypothetical protein
MAQDTKSLTVPLCDIVEPHLVDEVIAPIRTANLPWLLQHGPGERREFRR